MSQDATSKRDLSPVEEIAEDVVGFNFRSFRTFGDLIARPNRLFRAYAARDHQTYTPALRLWLGTSIILGVLTFFFGGHADMMTRIIANGPAEQRERLLSQIGGDLSALTDAYAQMFSLLQPIIIALMMIIMVFVMAAFRRGLTWVARINMTFSVSLAGSLVGLALFPLLVRRPELGLLVLVPVWIAYWLTVFRGSKDVLATSMTGRVLKATLFSVMTLGLVFLAGMITVSISLTYAIGTLQPGS